MKPEIDRPGRLEAWLSSPHPAVFQGQDLVAASARIAACDLRGCTFLGCVMDEISMILLTLPIFLPTVAALDLFGLEQTDKIIWFGILILMVVEIGLLLPPVGLNVYVINGLARDIPIRDTYIGVMPFVASDFIRTALLLAFPVLSLWLVKVLVG